MLNKFIDKIKKDKEFIYFITISYFSFSSKEKLNKTKKKKEMIIERRIKGHVKKLEKTEYREYNDYFSEELLEKNFYNVIEGITEKYKIKYLDYSHDYINFNKKEYFQKNDYDHLSLDGAKVLMRLLEKELKIKLLN